MANAPASTEAVWQHYCQSGSRQCDRVGYLFIRINARHASCGKSYELQKEEPFYTDDVEVLGKSFDPSWLVPEGKRK